jgi:uncharacterized phage protein (TIGR02220 family)
MPTQTQGEYWGLGLDFLASGNYIAVNRSLVKAYGLNVAVLIGELASEAKYWNDKGALDDGWFYSTVKNVEDATGLNAYYQREAVAKLQKLGFIEVRYKDLPRKRYFRINGMNLLLGVTKANAEGKSSNGCTTSSSLSEPLDVHPVNVNNHNEQSQVNKEEIKIKKAPEEPKKGKPKDKSDSLPYSDIIDYLNQRAGKKYRVTKAVRRLISARFRDGYTLDDFKRVIDTKCSDWEGTKYEKYLQPSTLFSDGHFDNYLNERPKKRRNDEYDDFSAYDKSVPARDPAKPDSSVPDGWEDIKF